MGSTRADVEAALQAVDTGTIKWLAAELGYSERSLWGYRAGGNIPERRLKPLAKALGLA